MVVRKRILWWLVMALLCLLAAVVGAAVAYWRHTVPLDECSEVYRRYYKTEGIQAAFIRDMIIVDTVTANVTLLVARDSATYVWLLKDMDYNDELIRLLMTFDYEDENRRFTAFKGNTVTAEFPQRLSIIIYEAANEQDIKKIRRESLKETLKYDIQNEKDI